MQFYFDSSVETDIQELYYSYNDINWMAVGEPKSTITIPDTTAYQNTYEFTDIGADCIYLKGIDIRSQEYYYKLDIESGNKPSDVIGIINDQNDTYVFGDKIKAEKIDEQENYKVVSAQNKIKKCDVNIKMMTNTYEKIIALGDDGDVYEVTYDAGYKFTKIISEMNFKYIYGIFAVDNENNIWKCNNNEGTLAYSKCTEYTIDGKIAKVYPYVKENAIIPFVLYEDCRAVILNSDGTKEEISSQAIDVSRGSHIYDNPNIYVLERDQIIVIDHKNNKTNFDISNILKNSEIPIKINSTGAFLTNKLNLYFIKNFYTNEENNIFSLSGIKRLGNYFYRRFRK